MDLRLTIELVPSTAWGQNLRDLLTQEQWDTLAPPDLQALWLLLWRLPCQPYYVVLP